MRATSMDRRPGSFWSTSSGSVVPTVATAARRAGVLNPILVVAG